MINEFRPLTSIGNKRFFKNKLANHLDNKEKLPILNLALI